MERSDFLLMMEFPAEWVTLDMYPDALWEFQRDSYEPGHESSSEHDRNGAFHWWLRSRPGKVELLKLVKLSFLDPDQLMAEDVRRYIRLSEFADAEVVSALDGLLGGNDGAAG